MKIQNTVAPLVLGFITVVEEMGTVWLLMSEVGPTDCLQCFLSFDIAFICSEMHNS